MKIVRVKAFASGNADYKTIMQCLQRNLFNVLEEHKLGNIRYNESEYGWKEAGVVVYVVVKKKKRGRESERQTILFGDRAGTQQR